MKDWNGNKPAVWVTLGATNHSDKERHKNDYYATNPFALIKLLEIEKFNKNVWENAVGGGHLANVLKEQGYEVFATDIINRGYKDTVYYDMVNMNKEQAIHWNGDIITNPPYKYAYEFIENSLDAIDNGSKIAMLLKVQFLEGQKRKKLFQKSPPRKIYVFSKRVNCAKNGEFDKYPSSAIAYAWFVWVKGFQGDPVIKWI